MLHSSIRIEEEMEEHLYIIFAMVTNVINIFQTCMLFLLHRTSHLPWISLGYTALIFAICIIGRNVGIKSIIMSIVMIIEGWFLFPALYVMYRTPILLYFVMNICMALIYFPEKYRKKFCASTILWNMCVIGIAEWKLENMKVDYKYTIFWYTIFSFCVVAIGMLMLLGKVIRIYEKQRQDLLYYSTHDLLTGIYNRVYLMKELNDQISEKLNQFMFAILDIDDFKKINDTYGHDFGDKVLQTFALIMKEEIGQNGIAARYGGEEFVLLFKCNNIQIANEVFARIAYRLGQFSKSEKEIQITFSGGLEVYQIEYEIDNLIKRADENLYEAKRSGKNKVIVS